jgi:hypothetical protein
MTFHATTEISPVSGNLNDSVDADARLTVLAAETDGRRTLDGAWWPRSRILTDGSPGVSDTRGTPFQQRGSHVRDTPDQAMPS